MSPTVKIKYIHAPHALTGLVRGGDGSPPVADLTRYACYEPAEGASFTPVDMTCWPKAPEWRSELRPKEHYWRFRALDELERRRRAWSAERDWTVIPPPPAPEPAQLALDDQAAPVRSVAEAQAAWEPAGMHALRAELARTELEARRHFARKAIGAGIQARRRAGVVRQQLAALEQTMQASGMAAPSVPQHQARSRPPYKPPFDLAGDFAGEREMFGPLGLVQDMAGVGLAGGPGHDAGAIAVGDAGAGMAELEGEGLAGGVLVQPLADGLAEELLGVGGAEGVHTEAGAAADAGCVTGGGDGAIGLSGEASGIVKHVIAITGEIGQDGRVEEPGDQALAPAFGVGAAHEDSARFKIDVFDAEAGDLVDAQAATQGQPRRELDLASQVADDRTGVGEGEAKPRRRARCGGGNGRDIGVVAAPPAAFTQAMLQLVEAGDGGTDAAAGEAALLAVADVGGPVVVSDLAQFQQLPAVALLLDPFDGGNGAGFVGAQALVAEQGGAVGAVGLGLVAAGAGLENSVKGVGDLANQGALGHRGEPPGRRPLSEQTAGSGGQRRVGRGEPVLRTASPRDDPQKNAHPAQKRLQIVVVG